MGSPRNDSIDALNAADFDLTNLALLLKYNLDLVKNANKQIKLLKGEIREIMTNNNKMKSYDDETAKIHIKIKYGRSFDLGMFKLEAPEFSASFITHETIIKENEIFDKKRLKERYPDEYEKYMIDLTPAVSIK